MYFTILCKYDIILLHKILGGMNMSKKRLTGEELLEEWKRREQKNLKKYEEDLKKRLNSVSKECKNCECSWYRYIPPTGSFSEASEYCGCRKKASLVNPHGCCEEFIPKLKL